MSRQFPLRMDHLPGGWLTGLVVISLLLALLGTLNHKHDRLRVENDRLRGELTALAAEHEATRRHAGELENLLDDLRHSPNSGQRMAMGTSQPSPAARERPATAASGPTPGDARLPSMPAPLRLADLPAAVQAALANRADGLDIKELELTTENGQLVYQVQGLTSDGRRMGMRLAADGTLLTGKSEVTIEAMPLAVRDAIARTWNDMDIRSAREILQKDQAVYELGGQLTDGRKVHLSFAPEGTLLRRETVLFPEHTSPPIRDAIMNIMGQEAQPIIREILENNRLTYQVGEETKIRETKMVLEEDGTVIGFESRLRKPKPAE